MTERALPICGAPSTGAWFPWSYTPNESRAAVSVDVDFLGTRHLFRNPLKRELGRVMLGLRSIACFRWRLLCGVGALRLQPRSYSNLNIINTLRGSVQG